MSDSQQRYGPVVVFQVKLPEEDGGATFRVVLERYTGSQEVEPGEAHDLFNLDVTVERKDTDAMGCPAWVTLTQDGRERGLLALAMEHQAEALKAMEQNRDAWQKRAAELRLTLLALEKVRDALLAEVQELRANQEAPQEGQSARPTGSAGVEAGLC